MRGFGDVYEMRGCTTWFGCSTVCDGDGIQGSQDICTRFKNTDGKDENVLVSRGVKQFYKAGVGCGHGEERGCGRLKAYQK